MIRRIILITGHPQNEQDKNSFNFYLNYYYNYFRGNSGGAYDEDEIIIYEQPKSAELKSLTKNFISDYAVIVLIGHGATTNENQAFQINKDEIIKAGQLELNIEKQLIIVESCRDILNKVFQIDLNDRLPKFEYGGIIRAPINRDIAKELYNDRILKCNNGVTVCFACSKGGSAWNYYFSFSLLQAAFNWHLSSQNHFQTLGICALMEFVKTNVQGLTKKEIDKEQNPEIIGTEDFPFAVSKF
ncbi:hypothetical protein [Chryseobacterium camelliae]|uniref:hypothetical protein n=1 Tax=Chryseobacterium camelliae TaxID=1265445 RepID=UPI000C1C8AFB|nr:hypothetical protein [Chryseobacterium camelliae]